MGNTKIEVAEEVFVDEVKPKPAVNVAIRGCGHGPMALSESKIVRMALGWVGEGDQNVPGSCDCEKDEGTRDGMELPNAVEDCTCVSMCEREVRENDEDREDNSDEALGENVERAACGKGPAEDRVWLGL